MNLAINAPDAMPDGGRLWDRNAHHAAHAPIVFAHPDAKRGRHVELIVKDAGMGADTQRRIVEPFFTTKAAGADA